MYSFIYIVLFVISDATCLFRDSDTDVRRSECTLIYQICFCLIWQDQQQFYYVSL